MLNTPLLDTIRQPSDLKNLSFSELSRLAGEIRGVIIETVSKNGGHLSSNLGVVELAIALHRVFSSPEDKIVWDVGHQCYAHKLLTGRYDRFSTLRQPEGIGGYPRRQESAHDAFGTGHASTSISSALGLLAAALLQAGDGSARKTASAPKPVNHAVAVIGDGALTGGLAYEALSHAGQLGLPLIVILNDNRMSISPNVGALSEYLSRISMKARYQRFRQTFDAAVRRIPLAGEWLYRLIVRMKRAVKAVFYTDNFFVDLGFEYVGPIEGHCLGRLELVLRDVKNLHRPVVVHVLTRKGRGFPRAERNPSAFHGVGAFSVREGRFPPSQKRPSFTDAFSEILLEKAREDPRVVAITAAMDKGTGLAAFKEAFPARFFDVGIAEEHAVTFAAGLAAGGFRPVVAIYSTFMQRACDQVIHDVALQNLPVIFALDRAGFVPGDGETHQGLFDISLFRPVPNLVLLAPASGGELKNMFAWALRRNGPTLIRYPKAALTEEQEAFSAPLEEGRGVYVTHIPRSQICLAFTGGLYPQAREAAEILSGERTVSLYNLRFLSALDEGYFATVLQDHQIVVLIEEGVRSGGFGEAALALSADLRSRVGGPVRQQPLARVFALSAQDRFYPQGTRLDLLRKAGLDPVSIAQRVKDFCVSY